MSADLFFGKTEVRPNTFGARNGYGSKFGASKNRTAQNGHIETILNTHGWMGRHVEEDEEVYNRSYLFPMIESRSTPKRELGENRSGGVESHFVAPTAG